MIRQIKIDGGELEDCVAELRLLAEFVRSQADSLKDRWPNLLQGTYYEKWKQSQSEASAVNSLPGDAVKIGTDLHRIAEEIGGMDDLLDGENQRKIR